MRASLKLIATLIFIIALVAIGISFYNLEFMNEFIQNHSLADEKPPEIFLFYAINGILIVIIILLFVIIVSAAASDSTEKIIPHDISNPQVSESHSSNIPDHKNLYAEQLQKVKDEINLLDKTDLKKFSQQLLHIFSNHFGLVQGLYFRLNNVENRYEIISKYAYYRQEEIKSFIPGEGISGQVAEEQRILIIDNIPENYITILSGLGAGSPRYLTVIPIISGNSTLGIIEMATFTNPKEKVDHIISHINNNFIL